MDSADRQFFEREFEFYAKFGLAVSSLLVNISICLLTVSFYQLFKVKFGLVFCILVFLVYYHLCQVDFGLVVCG